MASKHSALGRKGGKKGESSFSLGGDTTTKQSMTSQSRYDIWAPVPPPVWMTSLSNGGQIIEVNTEHWSARRWFFNYLDDLVSCNASYIYATVIFGAIFVSTITFLISNSVQFWELDTAWLDYIEAIVICLFTYDYAVRFALVAGGCCGDKQRGGKKTCWFPFCGKYCFISKDPYYAGKCCFALSPFALIDFLAIIPFYLDIIIVATTGTSGVGALLVLRLLRLLRIARLLKLAKFGTTVPAVIRAVRSSVLSLTSSFLLFLLVLIFFATAVYYGEQTHSTFDYDAQAWFYDADFGGSESAFQSIYHSMWWAIITITTVGYGDTFPITPAGKVAASAFIFCAVITLAFPLTLFGSAFMDSYGNLGEKTFHNTLVRVINQHVAADRHTERGKGSLYLKDINSPVLWNDPEPHYQSVRTDISIISGQLNDMISTSNAVLIRSRLLLLRTTSWARLVELMGSENPKKMQEVYIPFHEEPDLFQQAPPTPGVKVSSSSSDS